MSITTNPDVLLDNQHYVVCLTKAGLSIQSKLSGKGRLLRDTSMVYTDWVEAFKNAIDKSEAMDLARSFYNS